MFKKDYDSYTLPHTFKHMAENKHFNLEVIVSLQIKSAGVHSQNNIKQVAL